MTYSVKDYSNLIGMEGFSETLLKNHFTLYQGYVNNTNKLHELLTSKAKDATNPEYAQLKDSLGRMDVYSMVITGFSNYVISGVYLIAVFLLSYHLSHAAESFFQTMGWNNDKYLPKLKVLSNLFAIVIFFGYASMPLAVLLKFVTLPGGGH